MGKHSKAKHRKPVNHKVAYLTTLALAIPLAAGTVFALMPGATASPRVRLTGANCRVLPSETIEALKPAETIKPLRLPKQTAWSVRVGHGDTLSKIARREYGHGNRWPALWWINRQHVPNPEVLPYGLKLHLSAWHPVLNWLTNAAQAAIPAPSVSPQDGATGANVATGVSQAGPYQANAQVTPESLFEQCVIEHESGGNPTIVNRESGAGGLYQFLPSTWAGTPWGSEYPGGAQTAPPEVQQEAFRWLYARDGVSPWRPYDGC